MKKFGTVEQTGTAIYHSKMTCGQNKKNFAVYQAEDFIAAICQHIPEKFFQMVRYFGYYSNKCRGMRRREGILRPGDDPLPQVPADVDIIDVSEYNPPRIPSKTWRECIKKWEIDPLKTVKIIQVKDDEFCVSTKFVGDFTTVEGRSPANEADISAGITGTFQGGYKQTYNGTLTLNPVWDTKGYLGTFDHGWNGDLDTVDEIDKTIDDWEDIYFSNWSQPTWDWWGFIYHGGTNGTWVNSSDGNEGDITN